MPSLASNEQLQVLFLQIPVINPKHEMGETDGTTKAAAGANCSTPFDPPNTWPHNAHTVAQHIQHVSSFIHCVV